jgi:23S rRNA (pseudouridine1915-N3)-methyltransferase
MQFHLIAVGRIKHDGVRMACHEYAERAARYVPLRIHEVADARRAKTPEAILNAEADGLLRAIPSRAHMVALTRTGGALGSREFAEAMGQWRENARDVAFVIGGAYGLHPRVLDRAAERLSLSPMTLPHEIARLVLLEQLYRGNTILRGEPYHKGD